MTLSLRKFIRETLVEVGLTGRHIKKGDRFEIFLSRIKDGTPFRLSKGGEITIQDVPQNDSLITALRAKDSDAYNRAFRSGVVGLDTSGNRVVLKSAGALHKDEGFGSINPFAGEMKQVNDLQAAIQSIIEGTGSPSVPVKIGPAKVVHAVGVARASHGRGKADAFLMGSDGDIVARISLKKAHFAHDMMEWGGISHLVGSYAEIDNYLRDIKGPGAQFPCYRHIDSEWIASNAVYSTDVDLVVISEQAGFEFKDGSLKFTGRVYYAPDLPEGEWTPVLHTFPAGSRNDYGVTGTRTGIFPLGFAIKKGSEKI